MAILEDPRCFQRRAEHPKPLKMILFRGCISIDGEEMISKEYD